ncbi:flagellar biosynthesis protein FlhB [Marispirochaeta aestuarii]|uniref:flagellar biosynthesis protein FlhB n=1 Tax=Marispirochaeta aestuarii TaxID=1963862 RepID=UPI0029C75694|nr:flagellar biosynthesis protein FlhB [Marispirochaeta aestuarii]
MTGNSLTRALESLRRIYFLLLIRSRIPAGHEAVLRPWEIPLNWFAAEDEGRTEDPTEHKIRKAREEGKVAKSSEFSAAIVLLFPILAIALLGSYTLKTMLEMIQYFFTVSVETNIVGDNGIFPVFVRYSARLTLPVFGIAFVSAIMANLLQVGFLFTTKTITPDMNKIVPNLGKFLQRSFFSTEALFNLGKTFFKVIAIGLVAYINIRMEMDRIVRFVDVPFFMSLQAIALAALKILIEAALLMLALSFPDYMFQRHQHRESLKMSKQELKEERKMTEGDPLIKSRLRERMQQILSQNMMRAVPEADVVITNPTHFAIALQWKRETMSAPTVSAKGQDNMALRIREIARENSVPVIENKPLARALYAEVEIGDEIPETYYEVTAIILAQVYGMAGREREVG